MRLNKKSTKIKKRKRKKKFEFDCWVNSRIFLNHIFAYYVLPLPIGTDKIIKRLQILSNIPQCGYKEGQKFRIFWWDNNHGGKNLVFAMTIKLIPEFWRNQEIPEKFWKTYEQVKLDLFHIYHLFLILILIPEFCHPEPRPTPLRSYFTYYV